MRDDVNLERILARLKRVELRSQFFWTVIILAVCATAQQTGNIKNKKVLMGPPLGYPRLVFLCFLEWYKRIFYFSITGKVTD